MTRPGKCVEYGNLVPGKGEAPRGKSSGNWRQKKEEGKKKERGKKENTRKWVRFSASNDFFPLLKTHAQKWQFSAVEGETKESDHPVYWKLDFLSNFVEN